MLHSSSKVPLQIVSWPSPEGPLVLSSNLMSLGRAGGSGSAFETSLAKAGRPASSIFARTLHREYRVAVINSNGGMSEEREYSRKSRRVACTTRGGEAEGREREEGWMQEAECIGEGG